MLNHCQICPTVNGFTVQPLHLPGSLSEATDLQRPEFRWKSLKSSPPLPSRNHESRGVLRTKKTSDGIVECKCAGLQDSYHDNIVISQIICIYVHFVFFWSDLDDQKPKLFKLVLDPQNGQTF